MDEFVRNTIEIEYEYGIALKYINYNDITEFGCILLIGTNYIEPEISSYEHEYTITII